MTLHLTKIKTRTKTKLLKDPTGAIFLSPSGRLVVKMVRDIPSQTQSTKF